jgi:hypothetical protein
MKKLSIAMGLATLTVCSVATEAFAHGSGGDIAVFTTNGKADVGYAKLDDDDIEQIEFNPNDSVFQAVLVPLVANPIIPYDLSSTEPGYDANEGDLPAFAEIFWNLQELSYWDGVGAPTFSAATGVSGGYAPQPVITQASGGFHAHEHFGLEDLTADGQPIPDGVYLAKFTISVDGLADSDPYYMVSLAESLVNEAADPIALAEQIGEAVIASLQDPSSGAPVVAGKDFSFYAQAIQHAELLAVPEPTSLALVAMLAAFVPARRRG